MPGICVFANSKPQSDLGGALRAMLERMSDPNGRHRVDEEVISPQVGWGCVSVDLGITESQIAWNAGGTLAAVLDGEIYDADHERSKLAAKGARFQGQGDAELLLLGYEAQGVEFFRGLHGFFAGVIWDGARRRLIVVSDRFGMRPVFYAKLPGGLLAAGEIKPLFRHPELSRDLNPRGLAQFFSYGHLWCEDTLYRAVQVLPPGACLIYEVDSDRLTVERYWRLGERLPQYSPREFLERTMQLMDAAVARRSQQARHLGLSLSSGLDARTILGCTAARGVRPHCVSMGIAGSIDHRGAEQMAAMVGAPYDQALLDDTFLAGFRGHLERMVHLTDGQYLSQCVVMPTLPVYRELGIDVLLRGHAGELMHMDKAYAFSLDADALRLKDEAALEDWLLRHLRTYMLEGADRRLLAPALGDSLDELARESLRESLTESASLKPPVQRVWHLFVTQRLRRETAMSMAKFRSVVEVRLPYLDNDLVDYLLAAPPEAKLSDNIQSYILRQRQPGFLDVVNSNTGTRLGASPLRQKWSTLRMRVLAKLGVRGYQPYERLGKWLREDLLPLVRETLLDERCLQRGVFDADAVRQVVDNHVHGRRNHTFLLMAMMIFEMGQRQLVDAESPELAGV